MTHKFFGVRYACVLLCGGILLLWGYASFAQSWPDRSVKIVVPQSAGGSTDQVIRPLAVLLNDALGQPVVVDNKPGSGSINGSDIVAKAKPDGYTFLGVAASFSISPAIYRKLPFDPEKDFQPVTLLAAFPNVLVVNAALPIYNFKDLLTYAKTNPGILNYSSSGIGTGTHLSMELLKSLAKIDMVHVAYKGGAPSINALLAGEVQVTFATISTAITFIQSGRLRPIAVSGKNRVDALPNIPTIAESGVPGYDYESWIGLLAPAKTPKSVIDRLNRATNQALLTDTFRSILVKEGARTVGSSPEQFAEILHTEIVRWQKVVNDANIPKQ
jgi:tripartite-type tricarboxylate transporter receptor subunit TctC